MFDNVDIVDIFDLDSDVFFEILDPLELSYTYRIRPAKNFGIPLNDSIETFKSKLVLTYPPDCCARPKNEYDLIGNIALVERGHCTFKQKAIVAEEAGCKGIIIFDYNQKSEIYIGMVDDDSVKQSNIAAAFLLGQNGFIIKSTLNKLNRNYAEIRIPLNLTKIGIYNKRQPPWLIW